ncbi:hypothetical protein DPEC_G00134930 [Dallia pectoralis]|uniref:Uncharacterized protein n=1 Tax=Dallia pectoralis TaxID=75939 RepID=A0ACC2GSG5_DALPE|nr:hypothetical protein DPEC_G00134930 [Dallia pectoralis]
MECLLNTDPSIAHLLDHSLSRSDFEFNGQYYLQRYVAQQTVSKRIKRTPEGIDRTGVQLAGGTCFNRSSPPIISAVRWLRDCPGGILDSATAPPLSSRGSVKLGCEVLHLLTRCCHPSGVEQEATVFSVCVFFQPSPSYKN